MREHVEANKIEGVDDVDPNYTETEKAQFNYDSDQVCNAYIYINMDLYDNTVPCENLCKHLSS